MEMNWNTGKKLDKGMRRDSTHTKTGRRDIVKQHQATNESTCADRLAVGACGLNYERLDQLTNELLLGVG